MAEQLVIFISADYLIQNTNLTANIDIKTLRPSIIKAQDLYISPFLGPELDQELKTAQAEFNNGSGTFSTVQAELMGHLRRAQAEYTASMAYVDILFRFLNKAATTQNTENGSAMNREDLSYLKDLAKGQGDFYLEQARKFLEEHPLDFPTWTARNCQNNSTTTTSTGIFFETYFDKYSEGRIINRRF